MSLIPISAATMPLSMAAERAQMEADLAHAKERLEALRKREHDELRPALLVALHSLIYDACRAQHKIETRQFADGVTGIDAAFDSMKDAESALVDVVSDIHLAEMEVSDMQRDLDDRALWATAVAAEANATLGMMAPIFVRFTAGSGTRPVVINVCQIESYGPMSDGTFLQVGGEEYRVAEDFDVVDSMVHAALSKAVQP